MRNALVLLVAILLITSCATVKEPLPTIDRPALTPEQIKNREQQELDQARDAYADYLARKAAESSRPQPLITNVYTNTPIADVLSDIALMDNVDVHIIPEEQLGPATITLNLDEVPLSDALELILFPIGYTYRFDETLNTYFIGSPSPSSDNFYQFSSPAIVRTNSFAEEVIAKLPPSFQPYVRANGQTIVISAPESIRERLKLEIALVDLEKHEIDIAVRFLMVEWKKGTNLGMSWNDVNFAADGLGSFASGVSSVFSANIVSDLTSYLSMQGYETEITRVAEPRIIVEEGESASIEVLQKRMISILSGGGPSYSYYTFKDLEAGIRLEVQPFITRTNTIKIPLKLTVGAFGDEDKQKLNGSEQSIPRIDVNNISTSLKFVGGETKAIGGFMSTVEKSKKSGIPVLRGIPLLGKLIFGGSDKNQSEREIVVLITTKVVQ